MTDFSDILSEQRLSVTLVVFLRGRCFTPVSDAAVLDSWVSNSLDEVLVFFRACSAASSSAFFVALAFIIALATKPGSASLDTMVSKNATTSTSSLLSQLSWGMCPVYNWWECRKYGVEQKVAHFMYISTKQNKCTKEMYKINVQNKSTKERSKRKVPKNCTINMYKLMYALNVRILCT